MKGYVVRYSGDSALAVEFDGGISIEVNQKVQALMHSLEGRPGMLELVPSYMTLLVHYDPLKADIDALEGVIDECVSNLDVSQIPEATVTEIPVLYENAEDIE